MPVYGGLVTSIGMDLKIFWFIFNVLKIYRLVLSNSCRVVCARVCVCNAVNRNDSFRLWSRCSVFSGHREVRSICKSKKPIRFFADGQRANGCTTVVVHDERVLRGKKKLRHERFPRPIILCRRDRCQPGIKTRPETRRAREISKGVKWFLRTALSSQPLARMF